MYYLIVSKTRRLGINQRNSYKLRISPAKISNFKNIQKLKIKPKDKRAKASSLNKRRKVSIANKLSGTGFLDRIQNMSSQKKIALNLRLKEKMIASGSNN